MQQSLRCSAYTYQALDADSMDMEIDLSNLGTDKYRQNILKIVAFQIELYHEECE